MPTEFRTFRTYASEEDARPLLDQLAERGVEVKTVVDNGQLAVDPTFAYQERVGGFVVKLQQADFETARQLQEKINESLLAEVPADHYLYSFSDAELFDILTRPDEWSSLDVTLARVLLQRRGRDISPDTLSLLRQRRLVELARPDESHKAWIWLGYISAFLGGAFGILIGWQLHFHRKTLPNGQRVFAYSASDRRHGLRILLLSLVVLAAIIITRAVEWRPTYWEPIYSPS